MTQLKINDLVYAPPEAFFAFVHRQHAGVHTIAGFCKGTNRQLAYVATHKGYYAHVDIHLLKKVSDLSRLEKIIYGGEK